MNWISNLNDTIDYIENHLTEEIDYEMLGKIACCSSYHFQRMFAYMAGLPLGEYIRRRRMSLAAVDIQNGEKIIDVSLKYGYTSPTAFNRAFQSVHSIAPSSAKAQGTSLRSYSKISFTISIKGVESMNYRVEKKEAIRILGISTPIHKDMEKNFEIVPKMWADINASGTIPKLCALMDSEPKGLLGVTLYGEEDWKYCIGVASNAESHEFDAFTIPASTFAIFSGSGTHLSIQDLLKQIVTQWFPTSGYEYGTSGDIEVYINPDPNNAEYEVWIPVIKKP